MGKDSKDKKKDNRKKRAVSWYSDKDGDSNENDKLLQPEGKLIIKSKSLDTQHVKRPSKALISKLKALNQTRPEADTQSNNNVMEWLEVTLMRKRSKTRLYQCNTKLLESIPDGDTAYMSRMLAMGASPNATCRLNHVSACHIAALHANDALELLISAGAKTMRVDKVGRTPLHLAAWAGNAKQIAILLNFPKALQEKVANEVSPETLAEVEIHSSTVHDLTNIPCELNFSSTFSDSWSDSMEHNCRHTKLPLFHSGWTALHAASARAQAHCVKLLLAAGANPNAQGLISRTPLDVAGCAYYMHKIDVSKFTETIRTLLKAGSNFQFHSASRVNSPLHIAVELESEEAVKDLLNGGACVTALNTIGLTAMHVCVQKQNKELLQLLVNYENTDKNEDTVNARDKYGMTVLHAAIRQEWTQGVCIALGAGASVTMQAQDGNSPIHAAAALGKMDIIQEILTVASFNSAIDFRNADGETALFVAISHNHTDIVKLLLKIGADIEAITPYQANVFHKAAQCDNIEILEYLLEYDSCITAKMINSLDNKTYTPLVYAVSNNHPECLELLISKGAVVNIEVQNHDSISEEKIWTTPLHIAARKNHFEAAKIIIDNDITTIHYFNSIGHTPLHEACCHGNRQVIALLLHKGADLSGQNENNKTKLAPIDILMNNLSKPTEFMKEIFDSYISSQGKNLQESNCEVKVNYGILIPNKSDIKQMRVIKALVNTGNRFEQNTLLVHPLVQSFLYLKWKALLPFFYTILAVHGCFVLALNIYVVSVFYYKDKDKFVPTFIKSYVWKYILYATICLITVQEVIFLKIRNKRYFLWTETWLKLFAIGLAQILLGVISWESDSNPEWARLIATFALLFSWFDMMFLLSRFPDWGFYVLMFGKVASKVFKILLSFVFLIFGFAICFMIQFRSQPPFEGPWSSFVKTMVMMTSEYDYQSAIEHAAKTSTSIIILRIIFLPFLILVSIVLMNLIVGVAVNNVNQLEMIGNIKRLEKQVEFITSLEDVVCHNFIRKIFPKKLLKNLLKNQKVKNIIVLRPREATCSYFKRLPARMREAIFENAHLQKKQMDDELGSMVFKMKLDEIHYAIVRKGEKEPEKLDLKMTTRIIEDISKIRSDIDYIKHLVVSNRRRTINNLNSSFL